MKILKILMLAILATLFSPNINAQEKENNEKLVFMIVEDMPEFPGGEVALKKFIANSVKYPEVAKKNGISGRVYVTFVVGTEGMVEDAKIARGVDPSLDKEALRAVNLLPKWKPGKQRGENVRVSYTIPIVFSLDDTEELKTINVTKSKMIDGEEVFFICDEMPEFPGGETTLRNLLAGMVDYPKVAKEQGIQGKVYVTFLVGKDGKVKDAKIARGVDPSLDNEALRVINELPRWKPGKANGEPVSVSYTVPINFALNQ